MFFGNSTVDREPTIPHPRYICRTVHGEAFSDPQRTHAIFNYILNPYGTQLLHLHPYTTSIKYNENGKTVICRGCYDPKDIHTFTGPFNRILPPAMILIFQTSVYIYLRT